MIGAASTVVPSHWSLSTSKARVAGAVAHDGTPSTAESAIGSKAQTAPGDRLPRGGWLTEISLGSFAIKSALKSCRCRAARQRMPSHTERRIAARIGEAVAEILLGHATVVPLTFRRAEGEGG